MEITIAYETIGNAIVAAPMVIALVLLPFADFKDLPAVFISGLAGSVIFAFVITAVGL